MSAVLGLVQLPSLFALGEPIKRKNNVGLSCTGQICVGSLVTVSAVTARNQELGHPSSR